MHINKISKISRDKTKSGIGGLGGNKGAVAIRFSFLETEFAFVNVHLKGGHSK